MKKLELPAKRAGNIPGESSGAGDAASLGALTAIGLVLRSLFSAPIAACRACGTAAQHAALSPGAAIFLLIMAGALPVILFAPGIIAIGVLDHLGGLIGSKVPAWSLWIGAVGISVAVLAILRSIVAYSAASFLVIACSIAMHAVGNSWPLDICRRFEMRILSTYTVVGAVKLFYAWLQIAFLSVGIWLSFGIARAFAGLFMDDGWRCPTCQATTADRVCAVFLLGLVTLAVVPAYLFSKLSPEAAIHGPIVSSALVVAGIIWMTGARACIRCCGARVRFQELFS